MNNNFKSIIVLCFITLLSIDAHAQRFKHGLGAQLNITSFKESYTDISGLYNPVATAFVPGIVYKANLGFKLTRDGSVTFSISSYPFIGYSSSESTGGYLGAEIPLLAEFYFGDVDYFGAFVGVGASYYFSTYPGFGNGNVIGPQIEGGLQFPMGERVIAAKLAYTFGLNDPSIAAFPARDYVKSDRGMFSVAFVYVFDY